MFFDQLVFRLSRGNLKEENHYYPFGLPSTILSSADPGMQENRRKYQGNEYIKDLGLNWMDFHARQYDPQIGRFLGVDPLADVNGQEVRSPYAAMGNDPVYMVDPDGLENTVYMVNLPSSGINNTTMRSLITRLNGWMKDAGLDVSFVLFEPVMKEEFTLTGVGPTDGVIVFGEKSDVSGFIQNTLGLETFPSTWDKNNAGRNLLSVIGVANDEVKSVANGNSDNVMMCTPKP